MAKKNIFLNRNRNQRAKKRSRDLISWNCVCLHRYTDT